jgi:hypothetical protein
MPEEFQAEPPRWSPERPSASAHDRYAEVNFRKPEKKAGGSGFLLVLAVGLIALISLGLISLMGQPPTFVAVVPPSTTPSPPSKLNALAGTWIATAITIDGEEATEDDLAKTKVIIEGNYVQMFLPTSTLFCYVTPLLLLMRSTLASDHVPYLRRNL